MALPTPNANVQYFDNNGLPVAGGLLYTYQAGTVILQATYTDAGGGTPNTNPVVLNSAGRANVWMTPGQSYRFDLYTSVGVLIWTVDNIPGGTSAGSSTVSANEVYAGPATGAAATPGFRALVAADIPSLTASYASKALDNLSGVSINAALLAQTGLDLGSTAHPWRNLYLFGSGTYGTTYLEFTGTPTGARVWTFQDASDTVVGRATTDTLTNKTLTLPTIADLTNANHTHQSAAQGGLLPPLKYSLTAITADGAIAPHTPAAYIITKAGVAGMTLGAPTVTTDDGLQLVISSNTAFAHTVTATGLLQTGSASVNAATFAAFAGASLTLMAYQGKWNVISQIGVTFS